MYKKILFITGVSIFAINVEAGGLRDIKTKATELAATAEAAAAAGNAAGAQAALDGILEIDARTKGRAGLAEQIERARAAAGAATAEAQRQAAAAAEAHRVPAEAALRARTLAAEAAASVLAKRVAAPAKMTPLRPTKPDLLHMGSTDAADSSGLGRPSAVGSVLSPVASSAAAVPPMPPKRNRGAVSPGRPLPALPEGAAESGASSAPAASPAPSIRDALRAGVLARRPGIVGIPSPAKPAAAASGFPSPAKPAAAASGFETDEE